MTIFQELKDTTTIQDMETRLSGLVTMKTPLLMTLTAEEKQQFAS